MIPGNSVRDANPACRSEPDDALRSGTTAGYGSRPPHRLLQDIEEIIDKLAAVTQQLHRPSRSTS